MDVHCSTCKEPWDVDHLWVDAIYETDLSEGEIEGWQRLPRAEKLADRYREKIRTTKLLNPALCNSEGLCCTNPR